MSKKPEPRVLNGFGIVNPSGDMWTAEIFRTQGRARAYLEIFWRGKSIGFIDQFRIVRARTTTNYLGEIEKDA